MYLLPRSTGRSVRLRSLVLLFAAAGLSANAQTYELMRNLSVIGGTVDAMARKGDTLFIGGSFITVAQPLSYGSIVSTADGSPDLNADRPDNTVGACVPDGHGGWFVAGPFTRYAAQPRSGIARLHGDGHLDAWAPEVDLGGVGGALARSGNWLFTAGNAEITAVDTATGQHIGWALTTDAAVSALVVRNGILYASGAFTMCGGQLRSHLAAIDIATGTLTSWAVNCNGDVSCLLATPNALVVGGAFSTMAGSNRNGLAALDYSTALCTPWNPGVQGGSVNTVIGVNDTLYVGGGFASVGGSNRTSLAAVRLGTGALLPWNPSTNGYVNALCLSGDTVYAGGVFSSASGQPRGGMAAIHAGTGAVLGWSTSQPNGGIEAMAANGEGELFVGGPFTDMNEQARTNLAALRISTGALLPWHHDVTGGSVSGLCVAGDKLFIGGTFDLIDGVYHPRLGAVDLSTDQADPWTPQVSNNVNTVAVHGWRLYVGGFFSSIGGQPRAKAASFDLPSLTLTGWDPFTDGLFEVHAFGFHENLAYVGLTTGLSVVDTASSLVMPWTPAIDNGVVDCFAVRGGIVYFGGLFPEVNGQQRDRAAAFNATTGELTPWSPAVPSGGQVNALEALSTGVLIGTAMDFVGEEREALLQADLSTGNTVTASDVFALQYVHALLATDSIIFAGGDFRTVFDTERRGLAGYRIHDLSTGLQERPDVSAVRNALSVWPDPYAGGLLEFELNRGEGQLPSRAELLDGSGRCIGRLHCSPVSVLRSGPFRGTLSGMEAIAPVPGPYFIRMIWPDAVQVARLIVQK